MQLTQSKILKRGDRKSPEAVCFISAKAVFNSGRRMVSYICLPKASQAYIQPSWVLRSGCPINPAAILTFRLSTITSYGQGFVVYKNEPKS
ncbi:hypothetical protein AVEN_202350-1 [Araneus ventricosus]|uniref:Uncharacterized protein n=1 Tax=Araneus ventricosus TaxID=182803 RepID=A0A4Y2WVS2_ARAVE|nr:hypothetical protein AVEN_202350-1 [Araneus ventricosus]